jgi:hypothetical protein
LLKHKKRLRKVCQETRDPACKTAISKAIKRITRKKALERWGTKLNNAKVTPQAIWSIAKSLLKYNISYIFYAKDEWKGSIKKQKGRDMSNTIPVKSPENKIAFPTLKLFLFHE